MLPHALLDSHLLATPPQTTHVLYPEPDRSLHTDHLDCVPHLLAATGLRREDFAGGHSAVGYYCVFTGGEREYAGPVSCAAIYWFVVYDRTL